MSGQSWADIDVARLTDAEFVRVLRRIDQHTECGGCPITATELCAVMRSAADRIETLAERQAKVGA